jgi:hypothetical protein
MRKLHLVGLALVAVFAFSAFVATSAFAHEWLVAGKTVGAGEEFPVEQTGTLTLEDEGSGVGLECTGKGTGKVLSAAKDIVETATASTCKTIKGTCGTPNAVAVHLSWSTELETVGTELRDKVTNSGAGTPGWNVTCFGIIKDTCEGATSTKITVGTGSPADVVSSFDTKSPQANCSVGGAAKGKVLGELLTFSTEGLALEAS